MWSGYQAYSVSKRDKAPLLDFIHGALEKCGCQVIQSTTPDEAPFRITFETKLGERLGIVVYAFLANQKLTKNRPEDEHRFQVKYGIQGWQATRPMAGSIRALHHVVLRDQSRPRLLRGSRSHSA